MAKISIRFPLVRDEYIFDDPAYRTGRRELRAVRDEEQAKWWFSVLDIVAVLPDPADYEKTRNYWKHHNTELKQKGGEVVSATTLLESLAAVG